MCHDFGSSKQQRWQRKWPGARRDVAIHANLRCRTSVTWCSTMPCPHSIVSSYLLPLFFLSVTSLLLKFHLPEDVFLVRHIGLLGIRNLSTLRSGSRSQGRPLSNYSKYRPQSSQFLAKRDDAPSILTNADLFYYINITIGTPPQNIAIDIDTGSSDTWIISTADEDDCVDFSVCPLGVYNPDDSSTYVLLPNGSFFTSYGDGTMIFGDFITDDIGFGGNLIVENQVLGSASFTYVGTVGMMGIGLDVDEAGKVFYGETVYLTTIDELQSQGFINAKAYSQWLDKRDSTSGSILFGGVDRSKYTGDLIALPIQPDQGTGTIISFTVALTAITFNGEVEGPSETVYSGKAIPVLLDSGTTLTFLPDDIVNSISALFNVSVDFDTGLNIVLRALNVSSDFLDYTFGRPSGPTIFVPISELVLDPLIFDNGTILQNNGQDMCMFGIFSNFDGSFPSVLGDTFLRSAYIVYDLDNLLIGMASTNFAPGCSDVIEYTAGQPGIPCASSTATVVVPQSVYTTTITGSVLPVPSTLFPSLPTQAQTISTSSLPITTGPALSGTATSTSTVW